MECQTIFSQLAQLAHLAGEKTGPESPRAVFIVSHPPSGFPIPARVHRTPHGTS